MNTPWGQAQQVKAIVRGIASVSTAGHGGLRISKGLAEKRLSKSALQYCSIYQNGYYYFEEDCNWAVLVMELPDLFQNTRYRQFVSDAIASVNHWNKEYLNALEVEVNGK